MSDTTRQIGIRIPEERAQALEREAAAANKTLSELIRDKLDSLAPSNSAISQMEGRGAQMALAQILAQIRATRECLLNIARNAEDGKWIDAAILTAIGKSADERCS